MANKAVVEVTVVGRGVGLEDGGHDLGEAEANDGGGLGLVVVGGASEIVALGDGWLMLKEAVEVVAFLKIMLPTNKRKKKDNIF